MSVFFADLHYDWQYVLTVTAYTISLCTWSTSHSTKTFTLQMVVTCSIYTPSCLTGFIRKLNNCEEAQNWNIHIWSWNLKMEIVYNPYNLLTDQYSFTHYSLSSWWILSWLRNYTVVHFQPTFLFWREIQLRGLWDHHSVCARVRVCVCPCIWTN
jgi:hypothetical protein